MFWHSKSAVSMTFVCFTIAKLECQMLTIIGCFFSISNMLMHDLLKKKKICKEKSKTKRSKMLLNMIASMYSRRYGSYRMYLEGVIPYQIVMIACELKWFSHISNCHNILTHLPSCDVFHTQHAKFFATLDTCAGTMWFGHHKVYMC